MSRFDVIKFSPPPDQELICGICMQILDMPKESPCRHVFCKVCIGQALKEKSKCPICRSSFTELQLKDVLPLVQNMLNKLTMRCDNFENGCKDLVPMESFINHVASCDYVLVTCKFVKCGQDLLKLNQERHEKEECIYRDTLCTKGCGLSIAWKDGPTHECMKSLLSLKEELTSKNKALESKIDDLNSVISALNGKLQEFESKASKTKERKTEGNDGGNSANEHSPFSDGELSPIHSLSSYSNSIYDDYDDYHSEPMSEADSYYNSNNLNPEEGISGGDMLYENEPNAGEIDLTDADYDVDPVQGGTDEWSAFNPSVAFNTDDVPLLTSTRVNENVDNIYHYEPEVAASEQVETHNVVSHQEPSSSSGGAPAGMTERRHGADIRTFFQRATTTANEGSRKRSHAELGAALDDGYNNVEDEPLLRRSKRLQNRDPSPTENTHPEDEIQCVDIPVPTAYLLSRYSNDGESSDDDDWPPF